MIVLVVVVALVVCAPRLSAHCRRTNNVLCSCSTAPLFWWLCGGRALKRSPKSRATCTPSRSTDDSESVCSMLLANPFVVIRFLICCLW